MYKILTWLLTVYLLRLWLLIFIVNLWIECSRYLLQHNQLVSICCIMNVSQQLHIVCIVRMLGMESVSLITSKYYRLGFWRVACEDTDWINHDRTAMEIEGIIERELWGRFDGIVLWRIWKVLIFAERMHRFRTSGESKLMETTG